MEPHLIAALISVLIALWKDPHAFLESDLVRLAGVLVACEVAKQLWLIYKNREKPAVAQ